ncbi:outer membrane beta-barrel protein [Thalassotalea sp. Y01]|uniref:outer membrane beta-barrel protein n=1 Tax=Thalassotalea sp. Y01 TaxID=2729613 RepID=UPI00145C45E7|nr:outer membrane beta-barrel protein [Thalassotalea sp. Y01]NMP16938.1 porin family protein [Thalassotalea sp. Y01]
MSIKHAILATCLALFVNQAQAAQDSPYHHQIEIGNVTSTDDISDGFFFARYTYYLDEVEQNGPYRLNGFLAQSSELTVENFDGDSNGISGRWVVDNQWYIGGGVFLPNDDRIGDIYNIRGGYFINAYTEAYGSYSYRESDNDFNDSEQDDISIGIKTLLPIANSAGIYLSASYEYSELNVSYSDNDRGDFSFDDDWWRFNAEWFLNKRWSIGAFYTLRDDDDFYGVKTDYTWRITDSFSLYTGVVNYIEPDADDLQLNLSLEWRL